MSKRKSRKNIKKLSRKNSRRISKKLSRKNSLKRKNLRKRNSMKRSRKNKKLRGGATLEQADKGFAEQKKFFSQLGEKLPVDSDLARSPSAITRQSICDIIKQANLSIEGLYKVKALGDGSYKVNVLEDECKNI